LFLAELGICPILIPGTAPLANPGCSPITFSIFQPSSSSFCLIFSKFVINADRPTGYKVFSNYDQKAYQILSSAYGPSFALSKGEINGVIEFPHLDFSLRVEAAQPLSASISSIILRAILSPTSLISWSFIKAY